MVPNASGVFTSGRGGPTSAAAMTEGGGLGSGRARAGNNEKSKPPASKSKKTDGKEKSDVEPQMVYLKKKRHLRGTMTHRKREKGGSNKTPDEDRFVQGRALERGV